MPLASGSSGFLLSHLGRVPAMLTFAGLFVVSAALVLSSRAIRSIPRADQFGDASPAN